MQVTPKTPKKAVPYTFSFENVDIELVEELDYLGITYNTEATLDTALDKLIAADVKRRIGHMTIINKHFPNLTIQVYNNYVIGKVRYCMELLLDTRYLGQTGEEKVKELEKLQNKALRKALNVDQTTPLPAI